MRGICFISYYFEGVIYAILQDASDDVPLLDVAFPNINGKGNGLTLQIYEEGERENKDSISWRKLSIWELTGEEETLMDEEVESTFSSSSPSYPELCRPQTEQNQCLKKRCALPLRKLVL